MKKYDLTKLAMLGISAGLLLGGCQQKDGKNNPTSASEQMNPNMQTFYDSLSSDGKKKFDQLDQQHKEMAIQSSPHGCKGAASCSATEENADRAVEIQYNNQMRQRSEVNFPLNQ